jgi:hypothetical protein
VQVEEELARVGALFECEGTFVEARPHGSGHIHDTFVATFAAQGTRRRYLLQRLNTGIFRDPRAVCDNIARVTGHLREVLLARGARDVERRCLRLVETRSGGTCAFDAGGRAWRALHFIEGTKSLDTMSSPEQAHRAGEAFAAFAADLRDLPGPPLAVTIPHFHDLEHRAAQLRESERRDRHGRLGAAADESRRAAALLERLRRERSDAAALPRRTVHNDCKLNNLLLDEATGAALCVVDLDTVMTGSVTDDFGELARTGSCPAAEDERDLAAVVFDRELFAGLAAGYLAGAAPFLTAAERRALPVAGPTLALENGLRFLADHLEGDVYFRARRPGHNLDRARTQLALATAMLDDLDAARRIVASA